MLVDDIADRIAIACPDEIDGIVRDMWVDHTHGRLTENEIEVLDETAKPNFNSFSVSSGASAMQVFDLA